MKDFLTITFFFLLFITCCFHTTKAKRNSYNTKAKTTTTTNNNNNDCFYVYELTSYTGGTMGGYTFGGRYVRDETQAFDTPFFNTYDEAFAAAEDNAKGQPTGRTLGSFTRAVNTGTWTFQFFDKDNSWITSTYGFTGGPIVLTGGSGDYLGATGTIISERVLETPYKIDQFELCLLESNYW